MKKKILFINFGGLGDEILFLPSILSIKKEFPDSEITLALEPRSKGIISLTNVIDNVLLADIKRSFCRFSRTGKSSCKIELEFFKNKYVELFKLLFRIWLKHYDIVISSGSNKFISIFLFLTFIKERIGYDSGELSKKLLTHAVPLNRNQYAVKMYHDLVGTLTEIRTKLPEINVHTGTVKPDTILIHPGVSKLSIQKGMIKTIPAEKWAQVVKILSNSGKKVILAGGPDDKEVIETILKLVPEEKYVNMYGKTKNLRELAELISECEKFLCSDSAPLHIAAALGTKTYAIFASTDDKKLIPDNGKVIPIKATNCTCSLRPCLWDKRQTTCESLDCLNITPEEIAQKVIS